MGLLVGEGGWREGRGGPRGRELGIAAENFPGLQKADSLLCAGESGSCFKSRQTGLVVIISESLGSGGGFLWIPEARLRRRWGDLEVASI